MHSDQKNEKINNIKIKVTQIGSAIGKKHNQKQTLIGLGLNKMYKSVILDDNNAIRGMIKKVQHLIKVENINVEC